MKALTIRQPWASLILHDKKHYETRSWPTKYRGPLMIHAAKAMPPTSRLACLKPEIKGAFLAGYQDHSELYYLRHHYPKIKFGAALGYVTLVDCLKVIGTADVDGKMIVAILENDEQIQGDELAFGDMRSGRYVWKLENPIWLPQPIPWKGQQRLWNFTAPYKNATP